VAARFRFRSIVREASTNPARKNLEDIRRGEFEGLGAKMAAAGWTPDFGRRTTSERRRRGDRRADALIAYNSISRPIGSTSRKDRRGHPSRSGGYRFVKAMGIKLEDRGIVQCR